MKKVVRIRLKKEHFHNGIRKAAGTILKLDSFSAEWLIGKKVAVAVK